MERIPYSTYATASSFSDEPIFDKAFDLAFPDGWSFIDIYDSIWGQRYEEGGDYEGKWIMTAYVGPRDFRDRILLTASNDVLLEAVYSDLERFIAGVRKKVTGNVPALSLRLSGTVGACGRLAKLHEMIGEDGLFLAGDYRVYPTFESAFDSGCLAALSRNCSLIGSRGSSESKRL